MKETKTKSTAFLWVRRFSPNAALLNVSIKNLMQIAFDETIFVVAHLSVQDNPNNIYNIKYFRREQV